MHLASKGIAALLTLALLGAAASWMVTSRLMAPALHGVGAPPAALAAEAVRFPSASGSTLRGWASEGRAGAGAIVLAHGVRVDRRQMLERARFLHAAPPCCT